MLQKPALHQMAADGVLARSQVDMYVVTGKLPTALLQGIKQYICQTGSIDHVEDQKQWHAQDRAATKIKAALIPAEPCDIGVGAGKREETTFIRVKLVGGE